MKTNHDFTFNSDSMGYRVYCDGKLLGGASTSGSATHTSWGSRRSWQAVRADRKMHAETGRRICEELKAGAGPAYLRKNIP